MPPVSRAAVTPRTLEVVSGLVAELRGGRTPTSVALNDSLERDLGVSSLERVELLLRLEREFGVRLPEMAVAEAGTPADLVDAVLRAAPALTAVTDAQAPVARDVPGAGAPAPTAARSLIEVLRWHVDATPDRTHILLSEEDGRERPISYADLWTGAAGIAAALADRGVRPGETVALMLRTEEAFFRTFFGVLLAGATPVPIYPPVRADRIEEYVARQVGILASAGARLLVTFKEVERVGSLLGGRAPDLKDVLSVDRLTTSGSSTHAIHAASAGESALIQYTSGSTGNPKGVLLTHANLLANLRALGQALDICPDDVVVSWLPLYHDMGLIGAWLGALYFGMPLAVMSPLVFLSRPSRWLRAIHAHRGTLSPAPNFAYDIAVRKIPDSEIEGLDLSSWRLALNGSEAVSVETIQAFTTRFAPYGFRPETMCPVYGLAESSVGLTVPPLGRPPRVDSVVRELFEGHREIQPASSDETRPLRFVSAGRPIPGHEIRLVDESGHAEREQRVEGRVQFRGPSVTTGYYRNPEANAAAFSGDWMDSGDLGYLADGELFITGRRKDLIIRGGRNFTPQEVEELVGTVPGVRQGCVAAFGVADPAIGTERLVVVAETRERDLSRHDPIRQEVVSRTIDALGVPPDEVLLVSPGRMLKTSSGKIRRSAMREAYVRGDLRKPRRSAAWQWTRVVAEAIAARAGRAADLAGRLVYTVYAVAVLVVAAPVLWVALRLTPTGEPAARVMKRWSRLVLAVGGLSPRVSGAEHLRAAGPAMLVANHASYVDAVALMAVLGPDVRFVAKRRLAAYPFIGAVIRRAGHVTVERDGQSARLAGADAIVAALGQGMSVFTFPEGTFFRPAGILPFRLGAFRAAVEAARPVVPIALRGTRRVLRDGSWLMRRGRIDVIIGPPLAIQGEGWPEMVRLRDLARTQIVRLVGEPPLERVPDG